MKRCFILLISVLSIGFCCGQQKSSVHFGVRNFGLNVTGHFNTFSITTGMNKSKGIDYIVASIQVESIETGISKRDKHLLGQDYFDATLFPNITFKTLALEEVAPNMYHAKANLKIKGITQQVTIPLVVKLSSSSLRITSDFEINRRDFGVGGSNLFMSDTVAIKVVYFEALP